MDRLAGDEAAVVADQEEAGGGDLVDVALASERDATRVRDVAAVPLGVGAAGVDAAWRDDVDADVVRGVLGGEATAEPDQAVLGGRDVSAAGAAGEGALAHEVDDAAVVVPGHAVD